MDGIFSKIWAVPAEIRDWCEYLYIGQTITQVHLAPKPLYKQGNMARKNTDKKYSYKLRIKILQKDKNIHNFYKFY